MDHSKNHQKFLFLNLTGERKNIKKGMWSHLFLNSQVHLLFVSWTFCCKGSFCSFTAQQNEGLRRIKRHLYVELLVKHKLRNRVFPFLTCRLKSMYSKQNLVLACSRQAGGWTGGRGYASGTVPPCPSLPSPGEWLRAGWHLHGSAGAATLARPCGSRAPGAAPLWLSHPTSAGQLATGAS